MTVALLKPASRHCPKCDTLKARDNFTIRKTGVGAGQAVAYCKSCSSVDTKKRYAERKPGHYRKYEWPSKLRSKYGIEPADYFAMLAEQGNGCATCGALTPGSRHYKNGKTEFFYVDHCHSTGRVRGLLCMTCNTAIGLIRDDPRLALNIATYLGKEN